MRLAMITPPDPWDPLRAARRRLLIAFACVVVIVLTSACALEPRQQDALRTAGHGAVEGAATGAAVAGPWGALAGAVLGAMPGLGLWANEKKRHKRTREERDQLGRTYLRS